MMLADKVIRLNSSSRRVLLVALVVIAEVGLYRWILAPFSNQLLAAQRHNSALDSTIRKAGILDTTLEDKKAKLEKLTGEAARLQNELFTPDEAREFFASLPAVARLAGCAVQSVSQVPEQRAGSQNRPGDDSGIVSRKAVVTVIGRYNSIVRLFEEIQTYKRKVWVDPVKIEAGDGTGKLKCQVTVTLYCIERVEMALYE
ncbi:MAG: hypothetical protein ABSG82_05805 [Sedimentisphaerales bacterium]|jgi:Tfp pilus assembly protein PilO